MPAINHIDPVMRSLPSIAEHRDFRERGWALVRELVDPSLLAALREDTLAIIAARNLADSYLAQAGEYLAGSAIDALVNSPHLRDFASALLGVAAHVYMPFTAVKGPGQGAFTFHQDNQYTRHEGPSLNCWIALVDMEPANGCLRLVSGSHRAGTLASRESLSCPGHRTVLADPTRWDDVSMRAGDVCIFDRLTLHGSGPNQTSAPRIAYAVQFHGHDTSAYFDGTWALLRERSRFRCGPVPSLSAKAGRGE